MSARLSLAIVLASTVSAATLVCAPGAFAGDGATDRGDCKGDSTADYRVRIVDDGDGRFDVIGVVFSDDSDTWSWRMLHNDDVSAKGEVQAKDEDKSFRIVRTMVDLPGTDDIVFRAVNQNTGEVCRGEILY